MKNLISLVLAYFVKVVAYIATIIGGLLTLAAIIYAGKVIVENTKNCMVDVPQLDAGVALAFIDIAAAIFIVGVVLLPYANRRARITRLKFNF